MNSPFSDIGDHHHPVIINTDIIRNSPRSLASLCDDSGEPIGVKERTRDAKVEAYSPKSLKDHHGNVQRKIIEPKKTTEILGGDIGMSGSAWARALRSTNPEDVQVEHEHEGLVGTSGKVPSIIAYKADNPSHRDFDTDEESKFGFQVSGDMVSRAFFKMCVDLKDSNLRYDDAIFNDTISELLVPKIDSVTGYSALVDYLEWFYEAQLSRTNRTQGSDYLQNRKLLFVLTHPAACSDVGKSRLIAAAKQAGWGSRRGDEMKICSEAEAAALAEFVARRKRKGSEAWHQEFLDNTGIVILDHGALTLDCATFTITKKHPMLKIKGCTVSEGEIGDVFKTLSPAVIGSGGVLLKSFERVLMTFNGINLGKFHRLKLPLPSGFKHDRYNAEMKEFNLSGFVLKELMDANLVYIKNILDSQFQSANNFGIEIGTVIHSGGGSKCKYFHEQIANFCKDRSDRTLAAKDPQEVVCRGAVIYGLQQQILESRKARVAFGVCVIKNAKLEMHWFNKRGQDSATVRRKACETIKGQVEMRLRDLLDPLPGLKYFIDLYAYEADNEEPPKRPEDPRIQKIGKIQLQPKDITARVRKSLLREYDHDIDALVEVNATQKIDGVGELEFEVRVKKFLMGKAPLKYEHLVE